MVLDNTLTVILNTEKSNKKSKNMDVDLKEPQEQVSKDATLYNFGYAPKEVIEKFQFFCYQHSTLSNAIESLLQRDEFLKYKYRFISSPVTYQMLARPTIYDKPQSVRSAMLSLHKYMKQSKYKSVADAIEELLFGFENSLTCDVGVNTIAPYNKDREYTEISAVEEEALSKIADALVRKLGLYPNPIESKKRSPKNDTRKKYCKSDKIVVSVPKQKLSVSPKYKSISPKDKGKTNSPIKQKLKLQKLVDDPDYFPAGSGNRKCLWSKAASNSPEECSKITFSSYNTIVEEKIPPVDVETLTPMERFGFHYNKPCTSKSVIKHAVESEPIRSYKSKYMLEQLDLVSNEALNIMSQTSGIVIDLTGSG